MDVKAIVVIEKTQAAEDATSVAGEFAGIPLTLVDVLGKSVLARTLERLQSAGATQCVVITNEKETTHLQSVQTMKGVEVVRTDASEVWGTAEDKFNSFSFAPSDMVVLIRLDGYYEVNFEDLIGSHYRSESRVSRVWKNATTPMDIWVVSAARRKEAAFLCQTGLRRTRTESVRYVASPETYLLPLNSAADLRKLADDALHLRCELRPIGKEVRPGVWYGERARVDKNARIVAPAYIGSRARVMTGAVITRGSNVEHHATVDCGTVVQDATVLPFSVVGAGLDLMHAVLGNKQIFSLKRKVAVPIFDEKLVAATPASASVRAAAGLASLVGFVPTEFAKGLFKKKSSERAAGLGEKCDNSFGTGIVLKESSSVPANLVAMRDYGNQ